MGRTLTQGIEKRLRGLDPVEYGAHNPHVFSTYTPVAALRSRPAETRSLRFSMPCDTALKICGVPRRPPRVSNSIRPQVNGPLMVEGDVEVFSADGTLIRKSTRKMSLCRCGQSKTKPFCDSSHNNSGFSGTVEVSADYVIRKPEPGTPGENLLLTLRKNGPVHCFGTMRIIGRNGVEWRGDQANLCRCGQSANKPFCDGSHRGAGFVAK